MSTPLDLFALPGHKVKLHDRLAHRDYPGDQDRNWKRYLTAGRIYTVKQTRVF